jgi:site-specific recombinase XerD
LECGERRKIYSQGACRRCYSKRVNGRAFDQLVREFKPASTYNRDLFRIYVSDFEGRFVKNCDVPVVRKFTEYLAVHPLKTITSWNDIIAYSEQTKIRHGNHATHGCPFMRLGRALAREGKLPRFRDARVIQINRIRAKFPSELGVTVDEFYQEVASGHKRTSSVVKILRCVHAFYAACGETKAFLGADRESAERFVTSLSRYGVAHYTEQVRSLNRFFNWAIKRGHCGDNPFAEIPNPYLLRTCGACGQMRHFWSAERECDNCYRHRLLKEKTEKMIREESIEWNYNQYLFGLHWRYLNRYQIRGQHYHSTKLLMRFLQSEELKPMRSWADVARARLKFMAFHELKKTPEKGCPLEKIAYVLQELGVLPLREDDHAIYVERALARADRAFASIAHEYLQVIRKQRRSVRTLHGTFKMIRDFDLWLKYAGCNDLFAASEELAREYLLSRPTQDKSGVVRRVLDRFYRWAVYRKKTLFNPFAGIESITPKPSLEICSNETIRLLERYIKRSTSAPEGAMILCLIFYFGFTANDLAMASLQVQNDRFTITFHRGELSYAHNHHKRDQVLTLPLEPKWLFELQKRYTAFWQARLKKIKMDFPLSPLLLRSDSRHGRPLRTLAVHDRVKAATKNAVGFEIPISVIRRTGAHIYSRQVDAAILPQFGWSKDYSFDFVWRQRRLYTPKQK